MTVEEKIRYIAEHNGLEKALDKLAEECAEYAAARIKHNLGEGNGEYLEELADGLLRKKRTSAERKAHGSVMPEISAEHKIRSDGRLV